MNKPESLRAHLLATVPELERNPDRLLVFIDDGSVRCTNGRTLSFEYAYTLQLILTDYAGHPDAVMLPLLGWLSVHQNELLANLDKAREGVAFEADILANDKVDLSIKLPLTERVIVGKDDQGKTTLLHPQEPQPSAEILDPTWPADGQGTQDDWYIPRG